MKWINPNKLFATHLDSPMGVITVVADEQAIREINFSDSAFQADNYEWLAADASDVLQQAVTALERYFDEGSEPQFSWSFANQGTKFQQAVWQVISEIPYGQVMSYKEIAETVGKPRAYRAVANACGCNPLPIVVPCHRVVGSGANGSYTVGGYSSGVDKKLWLMELEGITL